MTQLNITTLGAHSVPLKLTDARGQPVALPNDMIVESSDPAMATVHLDQGKIVITPVALSGSGFVRAVSGAVSAVLNFDISILLPMAAIDFDIDAVEVALAAAYAEVVVDVNAMAESVAAAV